MATQAQTSPPWSSRTVINSVVAGYTAGVTGTLVGHPIDSIKVWMQTGKQHRISSTFHTTASSSSLPSPPQNHSPNLRNGMKAATQRVAATSATTSTVVREISTLATPQNVEKVASTVRSLYAGVSGPLVTVGMVQSINFAVYDSVRRWLHQRDTKSAKGYLENDRLSNVAVASMTAGAVLAVITNPLLLVKTKQQTASSKLSYGQAVSQTLNWNNKVHAPGARQALRNLYTGFVPHVLTEIGGRGLYFVTYEFLKRQLASRRRQQQHSKSNSTSTATKSGSNKITDRMLAASVSGIICWTVIFPFDAIRCRMYAATYTTGSSAMHMATSMYREAGWRSFYRGFGVTLLRAGPVAAFVLPIYDFALDKLSATTTSH